MDITYIIKCSNCKKPIALSRKFDEQAQTRVLCNECKKPETK